MFSRKNKKNKEEHDNKITTEVLAAEINDSTPPPRNNIGDNYEVDEVDHRNLDLNENDIILDLKLEDDAKPTTDENDNKVDELDDLPNPESNEDYRIGEKYMELRSWVKSDAVPEDRRKELSDAQLQAIIDDDSSPQWEKDHASEVLTAKAELAKLEESELDERVKYDVEKKKLELLELEYVHTVHPDNMHVPLQTNVARTIWEQRLEDFHWRGKPFKELGLPGRDYANEEQVEQERVKRAMRRKALMEAEVMVTWTKYCCVACSLILLVVMIALGAYIGASKGESGPDALNNTPGTLFPTLSPIVSVPVSLIPTSSPTTHSPIPAGSTFIPTFSPTPEPTESLPTEFPTTAPVTSSPSQAPTKTRTGAPTFHAPTTPAPTNFPTTPAPSSFPTTPAPTVFPTVAPTAFPTFTQPTPFPSA